MTLQWRICHTSTCHSMHASAHKSCSRATLPTYIFTWCHLHIWYWFETRPPPILLRYYHCEAKRTYFMSICTGPPIRWINDSPRVDSNTISAYLFIADYLESVTCQLYGQFSHTTRTTNCECSMEWSITISICMFWRDFESSCKHMFLCGQLSLDSVWLSFASCVVSYPDPPPKRKGGSGEYSTSSHHELAIAMDSAKS